MKSHRIFIIGFFTTLGYLFILYTGWLKFFLLDYAIPSLDLKIILYLLLSAFWLVLFYCCIYWWRKKINWSKSWRWLIGGVVVFSFILIATWPLTSSDVFVYIMQGRILGIYHDNPYQHYLSQYPGDPIQPWIFFRWQNTPVVYGPIWCIISAGLAIISGLSVIMNLLIFRLFMAVCLGISIWLFYKILNIVKPEFKYFGTFLYAWNPLLLFETINNGHNDIVMLMLIFLSLYLFLRKKYLAVLPIFILACLIKYICILILPLLIILLLAKQKNKIKFIIQSIIIILPLLILCLWPCHWGQDLKAGIFFQSGMFWGYYLAPIPGILSGFAKALWPGMDVFQRDVMIKTLCTWMFLFGYVFCLLKFYWQKQFSFIRFNYYVLLIFSGYLLLACFFLNEWYIVWLLPWLIIMEKKNYFILLVILTLAALLTSNILPGSMVFAMILAACLLLNIIRHAYKTSRKVYS